MDNDGLALAITAEDIRDKIYTIRGVQVMLDSDLATFYGYSTKAFNQQVKNNSARFPDDLMFQLTAEEIAAFLRSKNLTSKDDNMLKVQSGGRRYLPYAFTEQGIYMLMTSMPSTRHWR